MEKVAYKVVWKTPPHYDSAGGVRRMIVKPSTVVQHFESREIAHIIAQRHSVTVETVRGYSGPFNDND